MSQNPPDLRPLITTVLHFVPYQQMRVLVSMLKQPEPELLQPVTALAETISGMPHTRQTDGQGDDAIVHLHYFGPGLADWYITEKDVGSPDDEHPGQQHQAFGLCCIQEPELGYVSIADLLRHPSVNVDLYWTPKTVRQCRAEWLAKAHG